MTWAERVRIAAGLVLFLVGLLSLLFAFAAIFLQYGLPPCESAEPVFWALFAFAVSFFVSTAVLAVPRLKAVTRIALVMGIPAAMFAVLHLVIADNEARQAACAARSLPEAIAKCGAVASHLSSGTSEGGYPTLTLVAPGTTDRAWDCLHNWTFHADGAPSLIVDESVYTAFRAKTEAARKRPRP
jgi:hypothetical protein